MFLDNSDQARVIIVFLDRSACLHFCALYGGPRSQYRNWSKNVQLWHCILGLLPDPIPNFPCRTVELCSRTNRDVVARCLSMVLTSHLHTQLFHETGEPFFALTAICLQVAGAGSGSELDGSQVSR